MAPPKMKLHNKPGSGKLKHIPKPKPVHQLQTPSTSSQDPTPSVDPAEVQERFQMELAWCIQKLEESLNSKKLNQKQTEDTLKTLKVLASKTQPLIKKRQLMRQTFGDYRAKMVEDEKKFALDPNSFRFRGQPSGSKSYFVKKAAVLQSGKDFRFNFTVDKLSLEKAEEGCSTSEVQQQPAKIELNLGAGGSFQFNFNLEPKEEEVATNGS